MEMEDPFVYVKPDFLREIEREKRKAYRAKYLGRPIGEWGGKRAGAGRPRVNDWNMEVKLFLTKFQVKVLEDMGKGSLSKGIEALVKENM